MLVFYIINIFKHIRVVIVLILIDLKILRRELEYD